MPSMILFKQFISFQISFFFFFCGQHPLPPLARSSLSPPSDEMCEIWVRLILTLNSKAVRAQRHVHNSAVKEATKWKDRVQEIDSTLASMGSWRQWLCARCLYRVRFLSVAWMRWYFLKVIPLGHLE